MINAIPKRNWPKVALAILLLMAGGFLRTSQLTTNEKFGGDEYLYHKYVMEVREGGLLSYPLMVQRYIEAQSAREDAILPPTRFLYIFHGYVWAELTEGESLQELRANSEYSSAWALVTTLDALRDVSRLYSILMMIVAALFAWRLAGSDAGLAVLALMAFCPTQIHMSQHALIDGFVATWAILTLWALWEALQAPQKTGLLAWYGVSLALLVTAKENAFFVFVGLLGVLIANRFAGFGKAYLRIWLVTFGAAACGVLVLICLSGGPFQFITVYALLVKKAYHLEYAIKTGDGPWYRYLVDVLLVNPLVLLMAVGAAFQIRRSDKAAWYLLVFTASTYLVMCNVKYGMNLRYANIWDMPLCFFAFLQARRFSSYSGGSQRIVLPLLILLLSIHEFYQYDRIFIQTSIYEPITERLLEALKILK